MVRRQIGKCLPVVLLTVTTSCGTGDRPTSNPAASSIESPGADTDTDSDLAVQNKSQIKAGKGPKTKINSSRQQTPTDSADALSNTGATPIDQTQGALVLGQSAPIPAASLSPPAPPTTPAISDCYKGDEFTCKVEIEIVRLTNEKRVGLSPLRHDKNMAFVARDWSRQQGQSGGISHNGFPTCISWPRYTHLEAVWFTREEGVTCVDPISGSPHNGDNNPVAPVSL